MPERNDNMAIVVGLLAPGTAPRFGEFGITVEPFDDAALECLSLRIDA